MEISGGIDMKLKRFTFWFIGLCAIFIIWKLCVIETDVERLQFLKQTLEVYKDQLQLSHQQLVLVEHLYQAKNGKGRPTIYAITPTYARYVQKAELTRISQALALVPNVHWIVIEDAEEKSDLVRNLLNDSNLLYTHLAAKTPPFEQLKDKDPRWKRHRGVEQRNTALAWLRDNCVLGRDKGIVYFMDDDNTYSVKLFNEIIKVKKVGVWPVGLVGGLNAEVPILDPSTGKVTGYRSGWKPNRPFAIDMAGFAINLDLILSRRDAHFSYKMEKGLLESLSILSPGHSSINSGSSEIGSQSSYSLHFDPQKFLDHCKCIQLHLKCLTQPERFESTMYKILYIATHKGQMIMV